MTQITTHYHTTKLKWPNYHRIINSAFPPKDLFDDISDPEDWMLLGTGESKTNPRLSESAGNLDLISPDRRVTGLGSNYVMAPFTHISTDRSGRFHDGTFGAFYAANKFETAVIETAYHYSNFYRATHEIAGWIVEMRELTGSINSKLVDIRSGDHQDILNPNNYTASQKLAIQLRNNSYEGIVYPSVRDDSGECVATFYPDTITISSQGKHLIYHWDGYRIDQIKILGKENLVYKITE
jgi:hypothetical protein|tara:strand:- start:335 stop:1051 length:717 start_codon:yes stop_codon:yes gene_type:complete